MWLIHYFMRYCFQIHFWEFLTFSFNYNNQKHQFGGWGVPPGHPQQINRSTLSSSLASQYNTSLLLCCWGCFVVFWGVFCRLFLVFSYTAPREQLRESVAAHPQLQMTQSETGSHQRRSSPPNCLGANNKACIWTDLFWREQALEEANSREPGDHSEWHCCFCSSLWSAALPSGGKL